LCRSRNGSQGEMAKQAGDVWPYPTTVRILALACNDADLIGKVRENGDKPDLSGGGDSLMKELLSFKSVLLVLAAAAALSYVLAGTLGDEKEIPAGAERAVLAGGCFWCVEADLEKVDGVYEVISGYAGGKEKKPTYKQVASGATGHLESVEVFYDPDRVTYGRILDVFWKHIDPTDPGGQFVDRGRQYSTAIFYLDERQKRIAEASKAKLSASGVFDQPIVTAIRPLETFYRAEDYHQDYYRENPIRYRFYRFNSGGIHSSKNTGRSAI
jgi:peptide methionine sulfoxide reductase msrA/msrB